MQRPHVWPCCCVMTAVTPGPGMQATIEMCELLPSIHPKPELVSSVSLMFWFLITPPLLQVPTCFRVTKPQWLVRGMGCDTTARHLELYFVWVLTVNTTRQRQRRDSPHRYTWGKWFLMHTPNTESRWTLNMGQWVSGGPNPWFSPNAELASLMDFAKMVFSSICYLYL